MAIRWVGNDVWLGSEWLTAIYPLYGESGKVWESCIFPTGELKRWPSRGQGVAWTNLKLREWLSQPPRWYEYIPKQSAPRWMLRYKDCPMCGFGQVELIGLPKNRDNELQWRGMDINGKLSYFGSTELENAKAWVMEQFEKERG